MGEIDLDIKETTKPVLRTFDMSVDQEQLRVMRGALEQFVTSEAEDRHAQNEQIESRAREEGQHYVPMSESVEEQMAKEMLQGIRKAFYSDLLGGLKK
jgi:hypothetical protein